MSGLASYASAVSFISGYIPAAVKDAAGLCPKISEAVRHITWLCIERVFWPQDVVRFVLVVGYTDGFQIWNLQDPANIHEICSRQDKAVSQVKLLPIPLAPYTSGCNGGVSSQEARTDEVSEDWDLDDESAEESVPRQRPQSDAEQQQQKQEQQQPLGLAAAPIMAYFHRGAPALVRLFSLRHHDDVHLVRLTEPARSLEASCRYLAVGFARRVELYDALTYQVLFSVDCNPTAGPTYALGHRWLAYNLPPQHASSAAGLAVGLGTAAGGILVGGRRELKSAMRDGLQHIGHGMQKTLDNMLMPPAEGLEQGSTAVAASRAGIVAIRDVSSQRVIARFEDHTEPVEAMAWDPRGLQLITAAASGHNVLVHRALLGSDQALLMHDSQEGGVALGSVVFQHIYTLSRGYTPAVISDISVSDDGQLVSVSSAKGTSHIFRLPPHTSTAERLLTERRAAALRAAASRGDTSEPGAKEPGPGHVQLTACTRVRHGHVLLQEGLMPSCGFMSPDLTSGGRAGAAPPRRPQAQDMLPRMYVATRAGGVALYSLNPGPPPAAAGATGGGGGADEWHPQLAKEVHFCRPLRHFTERRMTPRDFSGSNAVLGGRRSSTARGDAQPSRSSRSQSPQPGTWPGGSLGRRASSPPPEARNLGVLDGTGSQPATASRGLQEHSKWLSYVELKTRVPPKVPIWLRPQFTFHTYCSDTPSSELNTAVRGGRPVRGRRRIVINRPEKVEGVDEENKHEAEDFSPLGTYSAGFKTTTVGAEVFVTADVAGAPDHFHGNLLPEAEGGPPHGVRAPTVCVAPAWGSLGEKHLEGDGQDCSLEGIDGVGSIEEVDEEWLKVDEAP